MDDYKLHGKLVKRDPEDLKKWWENLKKKAADGDKEAQKFFYHYNRILDDISISRNIENMHQFLSSPDFYNQWKEMKKNSLSPESPDK